MHDVQSRKQQRAEARERREALERAAEARARRNRRLWQLGAALLIAAVAVVTLVALSASSNKRASVRAGAPVPGAAQTAALLDGIPESGITLGDPRAPVTFVEFADLQCPFCRQYTEELLPALVARYVRTGKAKMEFRNLDFIGSDSERAALLAAAIGRQDRLWPFVDLFYANQQEENSGYVTDSFLRSVAGAVRGVDVPRAVADAQDPAARASVADASALAARLGIKSTPSFLVGRSGGPLAPLKYSDFALDQFTGPIEKALRR